MYNLFIISKSRQVNENVMINTTWRQFHYLSIDPLTRNINFLELNNAGFDKMVNTN